MTCVFVGYATSRAADVYRMFNVLTKKISLSQDVTWLNKVYGDYFNLSDGKRTIVSYDVNEDLESSEDELIELNQEGTIGGMIMIGRTKLPGWNRK